MATRGAPASISPCARGDLEPQDGLPRIHLLGMRAAASEGSALPGRASHGLYAWMYLRLDRAVLREELM